MPGFKPSKFANCRTTYKAKIYPESEEEKLTEMRNLLSKEVNNREGGGVRREALDDDFKTAGTILKNFSL